MIGVEEGFLPHNHTLESKSTDAAPQDIEEERRLFYVGITRAREKLVMSKCKYRPMRGKPTPRAPSRFLADIPDELLDVFDIKAEVPADDWRRAQTATLAHARRECRVFAWRQSVPSGSINGVRKCPKSRIGT